MIMKSETSTMAVLASRTPILALVPILASVSWCRGRRVGHIVLSVQRDACRSSGRLAVARRPCAVQWASHGLARREGGAWLIAVSAAEA
jgi:hypothetical protein